MKHVRANDQNQHLISIPKGRVPRTPVMQNPRHWEEGPLGPSFAHPQPHNFPQPNAFDYPPPGGHSGILPHGRQGYGNPPEGFGPQGFMGQGGLPMPGWNAPPGGFPNPGLMMPPPDLVFQNSGGSFGPSQNSPPFRQT
jgi:hypothetical protein